MMSRLTAEQTQQLMDNVTNDGGGKTMVLTRQEGVPLDVQLDQLLGADLRCPQGISSQEWLGYFNKRLGDCGRRPQDYAI